MSDDQQSRRLARSETHDLGMIIRDRAKVLKLYAEEQAAACMADFEKKMAAIYSWENDAIWKDAHRRALSVAKEAQEKIAKRCEELGIPRTFAPGIELYWHGRGENALSARRAELRRVAKASIEAMMRAAFTRIEQQSVELRTQIVGMGLMSPEARLFLDSLAPVDEAMRSLDFAEIEHRLDEQSSRRAQLRHER